jgi:hypothetical protein
MNIKKAKELLKRKTELDREIKKEGITYEEISSFVELYYNGKSINILLDAITDKKTTLKCGRIEQDGLVLPAELVVEIKSYAERWLNKELDKINSKLAKYGPLSELDGDQPAKEEALKPGDKVIIGGNHEISGIIGTVVSIITFPVLKAYFPVLEGKVIQSHDVLVQIPTLHGKVTKVINKKFLTKL